jgi:thiol peroxidase
MNMKRNEGVTTFKGNPLTLLGDMVKKGEQAKDFAVVATDLSAVKLSDYDGKIRILSLAPSVDTPVCAAQTRRFNEEAAKLNDAVVMAISMDLPFALGRFCAAEGIAAVKTLSDHREADFGLKYGFLIDGLRILNRGIVVIDKEGVIQHVEYVKENVEHPDYDKAIEVAKSLA